LSSADATVVEQVHRCREDAADHLLAAHLRLLDAEQRLHLGLTWIALPSVEHAAAGADQVAS